MEFLSSNISLHLPICQDLNVVKNHNELEQLKWQHSPSRRATSGLMQATFNTGGMTNGRYSLNPSPSILHIRAQADIR